MSQKKVFLWATLTLTCVMLSMMFAKAPASEIFSITKIVVGLLCALVYGVVFGGVWHYAFINSGTRDLDAALLWMRTKILRTSTR